MPFSAPASPSCARQAATSALPGRQASASPCRSTAPSRSSPPPSRPCSGRPASPPKPSARSCSVRLGVFLVCFLVCRHPESPAGQHTAGSAPGVRRRGGAPGAALGVRPAPQPGPAPPAKPWRTTHRWLAPAPGRRPVLVCFWCSTLPDGGRFGPIRADFGRRQGEGRKRLRPCRSRPEPYCLWRRRADSNRRIRVLQTLALPLGYVAMRIAALSATDASNTIPGVDHRRKALGPRSGVCSGAPGSGPIWTTQGGSEPPAGRHGHGKVGSGARIGAPGTR